MSKSDAWETGLLSLLFSNAAFSTVGCDIGLNPSSTAGNLFVSLYSASPGSDGTQDTNEIGYTSYARVAVARGSGWVVTGASVSPAAAVTFPAGTGGGGVVTHFGVGCLSTGAGKLLYLGTVTPNITCGDGVTPQLTTSTAITED